ncbi:hypothetical protein ECZU24_04430 [Escherichia coli]|nr:hypothetical protein ECZU24_04430 [Escherichia coli]
MQISGMESSRASAMAVTVSRTRSATGHTDRRFTVGARHSLSDKPRALFMASQNMADLRALA